MFRRRLFYIRFGPEQITILDEASGAEFSDLPLVALKNEREKTARTLAVGAEAEAQAAHDVTVVNPFRHPRVVVDEFEAAEAVLRFALSRFAKRWTLARPHLIMHPTRELEGGLSQIERRAVVELGLAAGAQAVAVHVGAPLGRHELAEYSFPSSPRRAS